MKTLMTLRLSFLALLAVTLCAPSPAHAVIRPGATPMQVDLPVATVTITGADHKPLPYKVELAVTDEEQEIGLMSRTKMADDAGMLFLFAKVGNVSFWMKDTLIPLDMLFIDEHGRIFNIKENAEPNDLTPIPAGGPTKAVIEIAGGGAAKHHIKVGNMVEYKAFH
jgi:uncharacterized membrane protein (UPF0127 family)